MEEEPSKTPKHQHLLPHAPLEGTSPVSPPQLHHQCPGGGGDDHIKSLAKQKAGSVLEAPSGVRL